MIKWNYDIQTSLNVRQWHSKTEGKDTQKKGFAWELFRWCKREDGSPPYRQALAASPEVFTELEDAKRDALEKLSMLGCPIEKPVAQGLRWIHEDI